MNEKRLISAGFYRLETFIAAILQREAYVPAGRSFGAVHIRGNARHLDAAGVGVMIAFYKVRDSMAGMRVRCTTVLSTPDLPVLRPFSGLLSPSGSGRAIAMRFNLCLPLLLLMRLHIVAARTPSVCLHSQQ